MEDERFLHATMVNAKEMMASGMRIQGVIATNFAVRMGREKGSIHREIGREREGIRYCSRESSILG